MIKIRRLAAVFIGLLFIYYLAHTKIFAPICLIVASFISLMTIFYLVRIVKLEKMICKGGQVAAWHYNVQYQKISRFFGMSLLGVFVIMASMTYGSVLPPNIQFFAILFSSTFILMFLGIRISESKSARWHFSLKYTCLFFGAITNFFGVYMAFAMR